MGSHNGRSIFVWPLRSSMAKARFSLMGLVPSPDDNDADVNLSPTCRDKWKNLDEVALNTNIWTGFIHVRTNRLRFGEVIHNGVFDFKGAKLRISDAFIGAKKINSEDSLVLKCCVQLMSLARR